MLVNVVLLLLTALSYSPFAFTLNYPVDRCQTANFMSVQNDQAKVHLKGDRQAIYRIRNKGDSGKSKCVVVAILLWSIFNLSLSTADYSSNIHSYKFNMKSYNIHISVRTVKCVVVVIWILRYFFNSPVHIARSITLLIFLLWRCLLFKFLMEKFKTLTLTENNFWVPNIW